MQKYDFRVLYSRKKVQKIKTVSDGVVISTLGLIKQSMQVPIKI